MSKFHSKVVVAFLAIFLPLTFAFGSGTHTGAHSSFAAAVSGSDLSYMPRVYLTGYTADALSGHADILAPVLLRNNLNLFIYGEGRYAHAGESWHKNPWSGNLGVGYRQIVANSAVLGAYVFGDYNRTVNRHGFWMLSPGIESLGRVWDFHANGYFPIGTHDWKNSGFAEDFGDTSHITFAGHTKFDEFLTYHQEVGMGADAELGRKILKYKGVLVKAFADGYYFHMQHNDSVYGGGARVTVMPKNYLKFSINYSYDNYVHNTFLVGLEVSLYNLFATGSHAVTEDTNLQTRLFDPIDRNLGAINMAGEGAAVPVSGLPDHPGHTPEHHGKKPVDQAMWFYSSSAANGGDGTHEKPYGPNDFTQAIMTHINSWKGSKGLDHVSIYFNPGSYNIGAVSALAQLASSHVDLFNGFKLYGMQDGYTQPALLTNRPHLTGTLTLPGDNTLDSLNITNVANPTTSTPVIAITGSTDVINRTAISSGNMPDTKTALSITSAQDVNITDSDVSLAGQGGNANGISISGGSSVNLENSNVTVSNAGAAGSTYNAILVDGTNQLSIVNSSINLQSSDSVLFANGISMINGGNILNISKSTVKVVANVATLGAKAISATGTAGNRATVNLNKSNTLDVVMGSGLVNAIDLFLGQDSDGIVSLSPIVGEPNSFIASAGGGPSAIGILVQGNATLAPTPHSFIETFSFFSLTGGTPEKIKIVP